jgi:outer membrane protein assembly factor BamB
MQGGNMHRVARVLVGLIAILELSTEALAGSSLEPLTARWSYTYYDHSPDYWQDQGFTGIADSDENLYWLLCSTSFSHGWPQTRECRIRSSDFDGNFRYEVSIGGGWFWYFHNFALHLVAGPVVVAEYSGLLTGFDTATGAVLWTRNLRDDTTWTNGMAYDGEGRIIVTARAWVEALSAHDGTTIWRRFLGSENPKRQAYLHSVVLDESRNLYFAKRLYHPRSPEEYDSSIVSLGPDGSPRFEIEVDRHVRPIAVAHGRILVGQQQPQGVGEVLDAETGARIARLPGTLADADYWPALSIGLISRDLGFVIQSIAPDDVALAAFELSSGEVRWRFPLDNSYPRQRTALLSDEGNILILDKKSLLEISPQGQLLRGFLLRGITDVTPRLSGRSLLLRGRWFSKLFEPGIWPRDYDTVLAYDLPGSPGEGRLGWNSLQGNAQGENRPREE